MANTQHEFNSKIFNQPYSEVDNNCKCDKNCNCFKRMVMTLQYYSKINLPSNKNYREFVDFCIQTYKLLLDDYIHIISAHQTLTGNDYVNNKCDMMNCALLLRHHRNRNTDKYDAKQADYDKKWRYYRDIMDSMHCYFFHLYDTALRTKINSIKKQSDQKYDNESFIDICKIINEKKIQLQQLKQFDSSTYENTKYNLNVDIQDEDEYAFMDVLFLHMEKHSHLTNKQLSDATHWLLFEEYDTDALQLDVEDRHTINSNVNHSLPAQYAVIQQFVHYTNLHKGTFSVGFRFYYWEYYTQPLPESKHDMYNRIDHQGYQPYELYVAAKYSSIKDEVLNNSIHILDMDELDICIHKTNEYLVSNRVKKTIVQFDEKTATMNELLHYGIPKGTKLAFDNILSIVLYCDMSDLSTAFSSTFRKQKSYDLISYVRERNREFAVWSKVLRETVELFGFDTYGEYDTGKYINQLRGPFFCGMSKKMVLPEFSIRLCGPTSTSRHIEVAIRFAGKTGILIALNNVSRERVSHEVRGFDCGWISAFSGESEWLFIGGLGRVEIQNIRDIETKQNYYPFIHSLFLFDCMLTGCKRASWKTSENDLVILQNLINHQLSNNGYHNKYDDYINDTFDAFINHKTQLIFNLDFINNDFIDLAELVTYSPIESSLKVDPKGVICICGGYLQTVKAINTYDSESVIFCDKCRARINNSTTMYHCPNESSLSHPNGFDLCTNCHSKLSIKMQNDTSTKLNNLIKDYMFDLFKNIKQLIIYTTSSVKSEYYNEYTFDLLSLISTTHSKMTNIRDISIEIRAFHKYRKKYQFPKNEYIWQRRSWLEKINCVGSTFQKQKVKMSIKQTHEFPKEDIVTIHFYDAVDHFFS